MAMRSLICRRLIEDLIFRAVPTSLLLLFGMLFGVAAQAATWELDAAKSKVIFQYSYKTKPYEGEFKKVKATFKIDPASPGNCEFSVTIPIADLFVSSKEVVDYLLDIELFDVDQFPTATFKANKCRLQSANSYLSDGTLTIRNQTKSLSFPFKLEVGSNGFHLTSEVTIKRLDFGVGQGYWANTAEIPNDVKVKIDVYAAQK
jgi:polyisoprenoid-binding protein YceI